jgi:MerR family mercuric resistance operon transcriptional regulator
VYPEKKCTGVNIMMLLTRGELAKLGGVNRETVRFYERNGLLPLPIRAANGYWLFSPAIVSQLRFIKLAQNVGFPLKDVKALLDCNVLCPEQPFPDESLIQTKIVEVEEKICTLQTLKNLLITLKASIHHG